MILTRRIPINSPFLGIRFFFSHYDTLGLERGATNQQIKAKYYQLAKKHHPDMADNPASSHQFVKIQEAYEILGDEHKRRQYDSSFYSNSYQTWSNSHDQQYQRQHQQHSTDHHNYSNFAYQNRPSFMSLVKNNIVGIILWCAYACVFTQIIIFLQRKMTEADKQRENWLMMADERKIEQRKKLYAQEIKEKNIYGRIIDLNCKAPIAKSTKATMEQKQSLKSLAGIQKDKGDRSRQVMLMKEEYI